MKGCIGGNNQLSLTILFIRISFSRIVCGKISDWCILCRFLQLKQMKVIVPFLL